MVYYCLLGGMQKRTELEWLWNNSVTYWQRLVYYKVMGSPKSLFTPMIRRLHRECHLVFDKILLNSLFKYRIKSKPPLSHRYGIIYSVTIILIFNHRVQRNCKGGSHYKFDDRQITDEWPAQYTAHCVRGSLNWRLGIEMTFDAADTQTIALLGFRNLFWIKENVFLRKQYEIKNEIKKNKF